MAWTSAQSTLGHSQTALRRVRDIDENIPLSAREVCQIFREVTFQLWTLTKVSQASWDEIYAGHFVVSVEGWRISIYNDCDTLDYCEECVSPEGRRWSFDAGGSVWHRSDCYAEHMGTSNA